MEGIIEISVTEDGKKEKHELPSDMNFNLMEMLKSLEYPIEGVCGGCRICSTCHVYINPESAPSGFFELQEEEDDLLDDVLERKTTSRLACQIKVTDEIDGLSLTIPNKQNK